MSHYIVSSKQVAGTGFMIAILTAVGAAFVVSLINYFDLPDVYVGVDGQCVKVVNYKNGDAYTCSDKDVVLRKYQVVHM